MSRAREHFESSKEAKRQSIEKQLQKAKGLRAGALADRQQRAAQHYEKVGGCPKAPKESLGACMELKVVDLSVK